jgi:predicted dehydrogenase
MSPAAARCMSSRRLRLGIVGCGEVTQIIHLPALHQLADRFEVTAPIIGASERGGVTV